MLLRRRARDSPRSESQPQGRRSWQPWHLNGFIAVPPEPAGAQTERTLWRPPRRVVADTLSTQRGANQCVAEVRPNRLLRYAEELEVQAVDLERRASDGTG